MNKRGYFLMGLGALLIAFALGLLAYNAWDENRGNAEADAVMPRLLEQIDLNDGSLAGTSGNSQTADHSPGDSSNISGASAAANAPDSASGSSTSDFPDGSDQAGNPLAGDNLDSLEVDGVSYIGYLSIPGLSLELPVISECSYAALKIAPARYTESTQSHGLIVAGHNYSRHFGKLNTLSAGDPILFTDIHGTIYHFTVSEIQVLSPYDIEGMVSGDWDLTLFTCTYGGAKRVTVRCVFDKS